MTEEIEDKDENQLPVEGEKEVGALKAEIAALQKQNEDYLDSLQRERASFANYKRRIDLTTQAMPSVFSRSMSSSSCRLWMTSNGLCSTARKTRIAPVGLPASS